MSASILAAFWGVSLLFTVIPGPDWAYTISAGIRQKVVIPAVGGILFGHFLAILLVSVGAGVLLTTSPIVLSVLSISGALYLLWLGIGLFRQPAIPKASPEAPIDAKHWLFKGVGVSSLNPKLFILLLVLLPQFSDPASSWPFALQMLMLGAIHLISCGLLYLLVGYGAQAVLATRPTAAKLISRISGGAMVTIALLLLIEPLVEGN